MKKLALFAFAATLMLVGCKNNQPNENENQNENGKEAVVYLTRDISPEGLVAIYNALGVKADAYAGIDSLTTTLTLSASGYDLSGATVTLKRAVVRCAI